MKATQSMLMFEAAAKSGGYHPCVQPSSNSTQAYTNPEGATLGSCMYCGFCERFGCEVGAKASPQVTVLPIAQKNSNFELRLQSRVHRILLTPDRRHATGVTYSDSRGREFEQPAELVVLCSYVLNNNRLMMMSGIGNLYNPSTGVGKLGRNYAYQIVSNVAVFFDDTIINPFMGAGAPDQRQLLAGRLGRVAGQQAVELRRPSPELRPWLDLALVLERCLPRAEHPPDRIARHPQVPRNLLDRLALDEVLAPNPRNCLHDQHPLTTRSGSKREACYGHTSGGQFWTPIPGSGGQFSTPNNSVTYRRTTGPSADDRKG
jgi:hypothetical protein